MAGPSKATSSDRPDVGWAALAQGRWEPARAFFEEALAAGQTPEAFEGLSWAAWWLDDADVVFEARERAYAVWWMEFAEGSINRLARDLATRSWMGPWQAARLFARLNVKRSFASFRAAADECADSRVRLGFHFRYATDGGRLLGRRVGAHILRRRFEPRAQFSSAPQSSSARMR